MCDSPQTFHADKVRCETLDVELIEVLASFDEVDVTFLEFAPFDNQLLLIAFPKRFEELPVAVIDADMCVPKTSPHSLDGSVFKVEEDSV